jgi:hypothetical protein
MKKFAFLAMLLGSSFLYGCGEAPKKTEPGKTEPAATGTDDKKPADATPAATGTEEKKDGETK